MSRIGKQPVAMPAGVKVKYQNRSISVEGPKGTLRFEHHPDVSVQVDEGKKQILVTRKDDERLSRSLHGLTRSLIANMVQGVTKGYEKKLKIEGIGYQARMDGKTVVLSLGYAMPVRRTPPEGVTVSVDKDQVTITVSGADKQMVGQFAAEVRSAKKPEPYKGKGVRYLGENVRIKEGKSFASG